MSTGTFIVACAQLSPGDDREAGAVDPLRAFGRVRDDPPLGDRDVAAAKLPGADLDEPVLEEQAQALPAAGAAAGTRPSASLARSTTASGGTAAARAWRLKASALFTFGTTARATATRTT